MTPLALVLLVALPTGLWIAYRLFKEMVDRVAKLDRLRRVDAALRWNEGR